MIIIKLGLIIGLCYIIGRGLARESEKEAELARKETSEVKSKAQETCQLMQDENKKLVNTVNELREEIKVLKQLDRGRK